MTRSSFHHYFSSLDELAVGLLEEFEQDLRASVDPWLRGRGSGRPEGLALALPGPPGLWPGPDPC